MYAMAYENKAIYKFCIYGILAVKMSNGRGDLRHPPEYNVSKFKRKLNLTHFLIYHCHRGELCDCFAYRINYLFSFSATVSSVDIYLNRTKRGKNWFNLSCIVF